MESVLWEKIDTINELLHRVVCSYKFIASSTVSMSPRCLRYVDDALAIFELIASDSSLRSIFLKEQIPLYLYPFLSNGSVKLSFRVLRLHSLFVIAALLNNGSTEDSVQFLLSTEFVPICLNIMNYDTSPVNQIWATYILLKILLDQAGLEYICQTYERFTSLVVSLHQIIVQVAQNQNRWRLKWQLMFAAGCYLRLADNRRTRFVLAECLPYQLRDETFLPCLLNDEYKDTNKWLRKLFVEFRTQRVPMGG